MKTIPLLKKIACLNDKVFRLSRNVKDVIDVEGLDFSGAYLISGCSVKGNHLYQDGCRLENFGLVDDLYFCSQYTGYCDDYYYGTLYFKTNVPGQFVAVPFSM